MYGIDRDIVGYGYSANNDSYILQLSNIFFIFFIELEPYGSFYV